MKVTEVVLTLLICQLLYRKLLAYTTSLARNMHPSTQCTLHLTIQLPEHLTVHHKPLPDQCAATYLSAPIVIRIQTVLQYTQTSQMKRKKIFRWYHWMTSTGHQSKYLKELFAYMKMEYHTTYANIHALMGAMTLFHTWIAWT